MSKIGGYQRPIFTCLTCPTRRAGCGLLQLDQQGCSLFHVKHVAGISLCRGAYHAGRPVAQFRSSIVGATSSARFVA